MLETVREYALQQASDAAEIAELSRRHAAYFVKLAEQAEPKFASVDAPEWLYRLEADHNNLRAALRWALDESNADAALRLNSAVWQFWYARGYLTEGSRWLDDSLRLADAASHGLPDTEDAPRAPRHVKVRRTALTGAGILAHYQGHYARGAMLCGQALTLCRHTGDQLGTARTLHGLAFRR
jgi:non-specific serine/threonine protein kinase